MSYYYTGNSISYDVRLGAEGSPVPFAEGYLGERGRVVLVEVDEAQLAAFRRRLGQNRRVLEGESCSVFAV